MKTCDITLFGYLIIYCLWPHLVVNYNQPCITGIAYGVCCNVKVIISKDVNIEEAVSTHNNNCSSISDVSVPCPA